MDIFKIECLMKDMTAEMIYNRFNDSGVPDNGYKSANASPGSVHRQTPSPTDSGLESDDSPGRANQGTKRIDEALTELDSSKSSTSASQEDGDGVGADGKPTHSYIALISMAILSVPERKMLLCDIYQYIMDTFEYYNNEEKPWRNSIRHNLSLNECFIKAGRSDNGKGNLWTIHPACIDDFARGDFRRRQARRRAKKCTKTVSGHQMGRSSYNINVGYVPMTSSHIAYHPYCNAASMYYMQQSTAFSPVSPAHSSITSRTPSLTSQSNHIMIPDQTAFSPVYQDHYSMTSMMSAKSNPFSRSHQSAYYSEYSYMSDPSASAVSKRFLVDRTGATVYTMQDYEL